MKIDQKYSHLNGEEYLIVHHKNLYKKIKEIIKISEEKRMVGKRLYSPILLSASKKCYYPAFSSFVN